MNSEGLRPAVKSFSCPGCGGIVELRTPGMALSAVCIHCGRTLDTSDENVRVLQEVESRMTYKPLIPLGSRGRLKGVIWEVTGFMVRRAPLYDYRWQEYLLFNPIHGYRWLTHIGNHWSFVSPVMVPPKFGEGGLLQHEGKTFKHFSGSVVEVYFVLGEFYWKVERGSRVQMTDYIHPPFGLSMEMDSGGKVWSQTEYMEPQEVRDAFGLKVNMPEPEGVAYNQVNRYRWLVRRMSAVGFASIAIMFIAQMVFNSMATRKLVHEERFSIPYGKDTSLVTQPFEIPGAIGNLEVHLEAMPLSNAWIEADGYLVREGEEKHHNFQMTAAYWHGSDFDGAWSEGGRTARNLISFVPGGKYTLTLHTASGEDPPNTPPGMCDVDITFRRGVPFGSNFWLFSLVVALPMIVMVVLHRRFETKRKENA